MTQAFAALLRQKTVAQGWKLEQILRQQEKQPTYHQMDNDFRPQIEAGQASISKTNSLA